MPVLQIWHSSAPMVSTMMQYRGLYFFFSYAMSMSFIHRVSYIYAFLLRMDSLHHSCAPVHACTRVRMYVCVLCVNTCVSVCLCVCVCIHISICLRKIDYSNMCECMYVCMYVCMCVCVYVHM